MAIPKDPVALEARVLQAGETLRSIDRAIHELLAGGTPAEGGYRSNLKLIAKVAGDTAESVLT